MLKNDSIHFLLLGKIMTAIYFKSLKTLTNPKCSSICTYKNNNHSIIPPHWLLCRGLLLNQQYDLILQSPKWWGTIISEELVVHYHYQNPFQCRVLNDSRGEVHLSSPNPLSCSFLWTFLQYGTYVACYPAQTP